MPGPGDKTVKHGGNMKSIFDRSFRYTSSAETDLRKTFARVRRRIREEEELRALAEVEAKAKVSPIKQQKNMAL
jgi:hypothetical protein